LIYILFPYIKRVFHYENVKYCLNWLLNSWHFEERQGCL